MKLGKTLGAIICASALAMATTVPAFAALPTASDPKPFSQTDTDGKKGSGDTEVSGYATNFQIVATIPFIASVYMPLQGGNFIAVPDYDVYCIENKGNIPITVTGIEGTAIDDNKFELVEGSATGVTKNQVYMTIQAKEIDGASPGTALTRAINVKSGTADAFKTGDGSPDRFGVAANSKTGLTIGGGVNISNSAPLSEAVTYKLVNVKYTVAA